MRTWFGTGQATQPLADADPAIHWQVMRDLSEEALNAIAAERSVRKAKGDSAAGDRISRGSVAPAFSQTNGLVS